MFCRLSWWVPFCFLYIADFQRFTKNLRGF
nr:MAG TPA: putative cellulose synthase A [Caudoviricetes sp.]DAW45404.1 MAG TPA: putative cellulose synthase A [Bacteriophage sp.]